LNFVVGLLRSSDDVRAAGEWAAQSALLRRPSSQQLSFLQQFQWLRGGRRERSRSSSGGAQCFLVMVEGENDRPLRTLAILREFQLSDVF
jgi:hypothetical protein